MGKVLVFILFCLLSFTQFLNSHDFQQYILQAEQLENIRDFGPLNVYVFFIDFLLSLLNKAELFVYALWVLNWVFIFYFFIYKGKDKFNFWFLISYLILFEYLWHSNQFRQGLIMPAFIFFYFKILDNKINNMKYLTISSILSVWHLVSLSMFSYYIKFRLHYLIPFALIFSFYMGGNNTLINISSVSVLFMILISLKKKIKSINLISFFFIVFLVFRPFSEIISSRMLELSLLVIPFLFIERCSLTYKIIFSALAVFITLNNLNILTWF